MCLGNLQPFTKYTPIHIIAKLFQDEDKLLKSTREKQLVMHRRALIRLILAS